MSNRERKHQIREQKLRDRAALPADDRKRLSLLATDRLLALSSLSCCKKILLFYPFRDEIDTRPFLESALLRGQQIWLPLTKQKERQLIPYVYGGQDTLRQGAYGICEPDPAVAQRAEIAELDAVIVPGVAFDQAGGRMGYGGGFYDRFLTELQRKPLLIGYCFSTQLISQVPTESHDVQMDYLVTENGTWGPFPLEVS